MRLCTLLIAMCLALARPVAAQEVVSLRPGEETPARFRPYARAELTITNSTGQVVRGLSVRWKSGGPTFLHEAVIAPGEKRSLSIPLPALSVQSTYEVQLLAQPPMANDTDNRVLARHDATVTWPASAVEEARYIFLDSRSYRQVESNLPLWSQSLRGNLFVTLLLTCLTCAGAAFLRNPSLRIVAVLAVASAGVLVSALQLTREKNVQEQFIPAGRISAQSQPAVAAEVSDKLLMLTCRRTTRWSGPAVGVAPVYAGLRDLANDSTIIIWDGELSTTIHPDKPRLLRIRE